MELDAKDRQILELLQRDAKKTIKEIASETQLSTTPVYERIKRLEKRGYIKRYSALLDRYMLDRSLMAFCNISLNAHQKSFLEKFERDVIQLPEVISCYHIAGMYDYLVVVLVSDMETYHQFVVHKLAALDHIGKVQSSFVMTTVKEYEGIRF